MEILQLEAVASAGRMCTAPFKWGWAMLASLRWAWRDMRDLPASVHITMLFLNMPKVEPSRVNIYIGIVNCSVFDVTIGYERGRMAFMRSALSGQIDSIEPVVCKPRENQTLRMTQWISEEEAERIRNWNKEEDGHRSFDFSAMRFPMRISGSQRTHYLEILGPREMNGGDISVASMFVWHGSLDVLGDRDRARGEFARKGEAY